MDSRMEIDFLNLNSRPQISEMAKQHTKASGMKWPFSSVDDLVTKPENIFFQNCNSNPIVSSNSKSLPLNNYNFTKESQYFGGALSSVAKTTTSDSRKKLDPLRLNESTLTIFYMGEVHIFQDITPEKAELIIKVMNKDISEKNKSEPSNASTNYAKGALAMARRATLARFLEKRKHRLIKARPYQYGEKIPKFPFEMHQEEEETASSSVHWES